MTKFFKATIEAVSPSHHKGTKKTVYGVSLGNQTPRTQAQHIGEVQGLGKNKVVKIKTFRSGDAWYKAQYGNKKK